ncbi:serine/threonine-protein kinase [Mycobacterium botniense]|uniref:non-specific serine/threonine protein kinase n=1 Tax=Mycobacterium botniense TaxID=84962 RepID=A0A7I9Y392_9MYCO|nr:serine/threonine-protein kinase [Mycobacterium botniense]GFG76542.1 hypothetical protein MBOT_39070 [Mycobacterium botniense]
MPLASGATFAGYTITRQLGSGDMGEVYLAQSPGPPRSVALKVLHPALTADSEFRQRFMRDTEISATLYHPHIVPVYDHGEFHGQLWFSMDYVDGTNAEQLVRERFPSGMPAGEVLTIVAAVANALDYAHYRGLLHRSVKPANILLTDPSAGEPRIVLTDFGIARRLDNFCSIPQVPPPGAVAYAAPEQLRGLDLDGSADQYGLAATAFHLFTGAPPFQGTDPVAVITQHLNVAPPQLSDRRPGLAPLDGVMATALAKDPVDRFSQCREFADALSARTSVWVADRGPEAFLPVLDYPDDAVTEVRGEPGGPAPSSAESQRRGAEPEPGRQRAGPGLRRWPWVLLGAAVGAALVVLVGVLAVGAGAMREARAPSSRAASPTGPMHLSAPRAVPTSSLPAEPSPQQLLDGLYRLDVNRSQQTFNDTPDPQPPDVSTWWAFRAVCTATGCVATGIMLDDKDHRTASTSGGDKPLVLDFRDGAWQSRPDTVPFPCVGAGGTPDSEITRQVLSLQPQRHGPMRGVMTLTVQTDECGQQGAQFVIPAVAARTGDVPADVSVPAPPAPDAPAAPPPRTLLPAPGAPSAQIPEPTPTR